MDVARSVPQGAHHHVDGTYLLPLTVFKEENKGLMVLRVKLKITRFPIYSLYIPMDSTFLHSIPSVCHPCGTACCCAMGDRSSS